MAAAVLRSSALTDIARQIALRLVACGDTFKVQTIVESWIHRHSHRDAFLALRRLECMGTLSPIRLATRPGEEDEDIHEEGNEAKKSKLAEKDAILTTEFKEAMSIYLITFFLLNGHS